MNKKKQIVRAYNLVVISLLVLGAIYVVSRFVHLGTVEYTDNAMVHRNLTPVNTRVQGFIKEIRFNEFQYVHRGDTLVVIEDAEYRLALAQAAAGVKGSRSGSGAITASMHTVDSNVGVARAGMQVASAGITEARVSMDNARRDYDRFAALLKKGAVTQQQFDQVKTQYEQWRSRYEAAQARLAQASASRQATAVVKHEQQQRLGQSAAGVSVAEATYNLARLNLSYTVITAPCDGYVGRKTIHEGQLMQPGQLLVTMVDARDVWVIANYRESQMDHIKVGERAELKADAVPGVKFTGRVQSISAATGAAYSNIPVDNSTGNFVKVEQRIPVRIQLTADNNAADIKRLIEGLNVECEVDY
jgi:membrane fusion protein (multidrug efflux system)